MQKAKLHKMGRLPIHRVTYSVIQRKENKYGV